MAAPTIDSTLGADGVTPGVSRFADGVGSSTVGGFHSTGGSDRCLVAWCQSSNIGELFTSVTYGGVSMTEIGDMTFANGAYKKQIFFLLNPAPGSNLLVATISVAGPTIGVTVAGFNGVSQDGAPQEGQNNSQSFSSPVATGQDELVVMEAFGPGSSSATAAIGTLNYANFSGTWNGEFAVMTIPGPGTVSPFGAWDVPVFWGAISLPLKPVSGTNSIPVNAELDYEIKTNQMSKNIVVT